jgi:hypothetical protein
LTSQPRRQRPRRLAQRSAARRAAEHGDVLQMEGTWRRDLIELPHRVRSTHPGALKDSRRKTISKHICNVNSFSYHSFKVN